MTPMSKPIARMLCCAVLLGLAVTGGCAMEPERDLALERIRSSLNELEGDQQLGDNAPEAVKDAEQAVTVAEQSGDKDEHRHLVYLAERRVGIARARAEEVQAREDLARLDDERRDVLLALRSEEAARARREAEKARMMSEARAEEAERARAEAEQARKRQQELASQAEQARKEADAARQVAEARSKEAELARKEATALKEQVSDLQSRLSNLKTRETERGVVVTVGDVLFEVGKADLKAGEIHNLSDLVDFLKSHADRQIRVEGHTDSTGNAEYNLELSRRRAESVRDLLVDRGIEPSRITAAGLGEDYPVADNGTPEGRRKNRRVDIILLKPGVSPDTPPPDSEIMSGGQAG